MISPNVMIIWPSTNASIPAGFSRVTTMDGVFPKGAANGADPDTTGGASTHTHTSTAHSHTVAGHTHTYDLSNISASGDSNQASDGGGLFWGSHYHTGNTSGTSSGSGGSAVTYSSNSNNPPYVKVIYIKANTYKNIPNGAVLFRNDTTTPSGFQNCDGTGGTLDLRDKYLVGADAGGDSGATGGSLTNSHQITHGHTLSHTHVAANSSAATKSGSAKTDNDAILCCGIYADHVHSITLAANSDTLANNADLAAQSESVEPAYKKLTALQNTSGGIKIVTPGFIAMWLGTLATIPVGWKLCDGNNGTPDMKSYHLKVASTSAENGNTGGSNTHSHTAQSHSHSVSGTHTHTASGQDHSYLGWRAGKNSGGNYWRTDNMPSHSFDSCSASAVSYGAANTSADSSNNEPSYRTVAFIQYFFESISAFILGLI